MKVLVTPTDKCFEQQEYENFRTENKKFDKTDGAIFKKKSSSQLAGSTASFGNWESLTGKERQQLYIQMDAGRKGPDVFFIQVILRIFCTNWLDSDSECLFQSFTNISEQRGAF